MIKEKIDKINKQKIEYMKNNVDLICCESCGVIFDSAKVKYASDILITKFYCPVCKRTQAFSIKI